MEKKVLVSLIITVLNEENSIELLLNSIACQTVLPDEVIIVDGGSQDHTIQKIEMFQKTKLGSAMTIRVARKKGNRSVGRNHAFLLAQHELIAITDAGCELDKQWLFELLKTYQAENKIKSGISNKNGNECSVPVIAGYYSAKPKNAFQSAVIPYVLVMPSAVNPKTFLPATRSMLIEKKCLLRLGGFDEMLSDNEDYALAKKIQNENIAIGFSQKAIVFWKPTQTLSQFYTMIFRFARGDVFAGILRPKVMSIFLRYALFLIFLILSFPIFLIFFLLYIFWAIEKNKTYAGVGWKYLPVLQITADCAVMHGSCVGIMKRYTSRK